MSGFYDRISGLQTRLLNKFGGPAVLTSKVSGVYDPVAGTVTSSTSTKTVQAAMGSRWIKATNGQLQIQSIVTMQDAVKIGDTITMGGQTFTVQSVETKAPAGEAISYIAVVVR
ncbi:MAG: hypothetical protein ACSLE1_15730 [Sphingobium sp.]